MSEGAGTVSTVGTVGDVVYVVKIEYESGSSNGEVVDILSVHLTEAGAQEAVDDWRADHGCATHPEDIDGHDDDEEEEMSDDDFWCPKCGWGADFVTSRLEK